jgi:hypothetical protein
VDPAEGGKKVRELKVASAEVASQAVSLHMASSIRSTTVTVDRRWGVDPRAIVSAVTLSGVLASIIGADVIVETTPKIGGWLVLSARSYGEPSDYVEIWMLEYGTFTEVSVNLRSDKKLLRPGGAKRRVEGFCDELENALGL